VNLFEVLAFFVFVALEDLEEAFDDLEAAFKAFFVDTALPLALLAS